VSAIPTLPGEPKESELLVPFESENIPADYKAYYKIKRNNFFASIQGFPEMWKYYNLLDAIWLREFSDLKPLGHMNQWFPLILFINAHAKMRISIELAFTGCLAEARSILRDAIEFVAHAHTMLRDPKLQAVWLSKNEAKQAFSDAFERYKKEGIFNGLEELHETWGPIIRDRIACHTQLHLRPIYGHGIGEWTPRVATQLYRCRAPRVGPVAVFDASELLHNGSDVFQRLP
jgi:hypothetical protein